MGKKLKSATPAFSTVVDILREKIKTSVTDSVTYSVTEIAYGKPAVFVGFPWQHLPGYRGLVSKRRGDARELKHRLARARAAEDGPRAP